jgi:hypothetical protein
MDSTTIHRGAWHVEDDGWLRKKSVKIIDDKNMMKINFRNEVAKAA